MDRPVQSSSQTAALRAADRRHVWHPFTAMLEYCREDVPIIQAAEAFDLIDTDGHRYLDGTSSLWCNIHGHRVPELDAALRDQLDQVAHSTLLGLANVPSIRLAEELVRLAPVGLERVFYSDDGSTAVEAALKLAFQYYRQRERPSQRDLFVCLSAAYHGDTLGAVSVGGIDLFHGTYAPLLFHALRVPSPGAYPIPQEMSRSGWQRHCEQELETTLQRFGDRIAAVVIEPLVQAAAGMLLHPPGYLRKVRDLTSKYDVLLIADEVATGFGRTGTLFACEREQVHPDLMCLSKGLTGGYLPLAATLATNQIHEAFWAEPAAGKTFYHGHTYTGNPLGCAVALASLRLFEQRHILETVAENTIVLQESLAPLQGKSYVADVRQCGIMVGIELTQDRATHAPFPPEARIGHRVGVAALGLGAMIRPIGDVVVLMPAPAMPPALVRRLGSLACRAIETVLD